MLACHFESSLGLMIFPIHWKNLTDPFCPDVEAELLLEDDDNPVRQEVRCCQLKKYIPFFVKRGVPPFFHSYEYPCSEHSFPSDRIARVSSIILHCDK